MENGHKARFHVRDFFGAESYDHQRAIYCHFHEHLKSRVPTWSGTMNTIIRTPFQQEKWNDLGQTNDIHTKKNS